MRVSRFDVRVALTLFCLLTCLYGLTASAHIYIADGETMYLVTEALVERGSFAQLEKADAGNAPRAVVRGHDGKLYAVTGPLQSLLAIPLYVVGTWVAKAFPQPFYGYLTRFFVCLFGAPVCAATAALLYLFGVGLRYRRRTALFVALTYALATVAWPYARTFYAESLFTFWLVLASWAVYRYAHTEHWGWMTLAGAAMGLGIATKYAMAAAGPALALYLLLAFRRRSDWSVRCRWAARTVLAGGVPLLLIIGTLIIFNYARFGSPLETGYTTTEARGSVDTWVKTATPLLSLYGLFFSSGKGFFFFSPPTVLALWGTLALARYRRNETWLLLAIAASYPLFYSIVTWAWHGGGNWGPRYIVCITPFVTLPIGAFLERRDIGRGWRVGSVTLLFIAGFWVQMSTILVNYSTYLFSDVPADQQRFHPAHSTLSAQWRLWPRQMKAWQAYDHALLTSGEQFYMIDDGFYEVEVPDLAPFGRWMKESGRLRIYARPDRALTIRIAYSRPLRADMDPPDWSGLHLAHDGAIVTSTRQLVAKNERETQWVETLTIAANDVHVFPDTLVMTATTWTPRESGDPRALSVFIERVDVLSDETPMKALDVNLPRPLPVSTAYPWSWEAMLWFYDPVNARPFDVWPWYVWTSGVPLPQARVFIIVFALILSGGLVVSTVWLASTLRRVL